MIVFNFKYIKPDSPARTLRPPSHRAVWIALIGLASAIFGLVAALVYAWASIP